MNNYSTGITKHLNHKLDVISNSQPLETEAATGGVLWKKALLKISQISQENVCVGVSF